MIGDCLPKATRDSIIAILRDRRGIDSVLRGLEAEIQHLMDQREAHQARRLSNSAIAAMHGVTHTTIHYLDRGRL